MARPKSAGASRFRPPRVSPNAALTWMLRRAFGPLPQRPLAAAPAATVPASEGQADEGQGLAMAKRFGLEARIGSRQELALLTAEVGAADARAFRQSRDASVAAELRFVATAGQVVRVADSLRLPLAFLKGFALQLAGHLRAGSRPAADLDVLAPEGDLRRLQGALVAAGFRPSRGPEMEHQLPLLVSPAGGAVELHRCLLGVRLPGSSRSATFEALTAADLLVAAPGWPGHFLPRRVVLLAHAAVHALVQHGFSPDAYTALRLVGDWIDLGAGDEPRQGAMAEVEALVSSELSASELAGLGELCRRLAASDLGLLDEAPEGNLAAALLHHFLAGSLDQAYASALKLEMLAHPLSDEASLKARLRAVKNALLPTAAELQTLYGGGSGPLARLGRRLRRPLDLAQRTLRHAGRALFHAGS